MDNLGSVKTIKQCKDKMQNLKGTYKRVKESNKKTGVAPRFPPSITQFDKILGCKDVTSLPEKTEVGANSISDDEINANSDSDLDNNESNILKQVPKKILGKGDLGKRSW